MTKNGYEFPEEIYLKYRERDTTWNASFDFSDREIDERWKMVYDWACVNEVAGEDLGSYHWKFNMLITRRIQGILNRTKLLTTLPASSLACVNGRLNAVFLLNTSTGNVYLQNSVVEADVFVDQIGLFENEYWSTYHSALFYIAQAGIEPFSPTVDILPFFPPNPDPTDVYERNERGTVRPVPDPNEVEP
jgi:hypothetical protein